MAACYYGLVNIVKKLLLSKRMDKTIIDMQNSVSQTTVGIDRGLNTMLCFYGQAGGTALFCACEQGRLDVVKVLLLDSRVDETTINKENNVREKATGSHACLFKMGCVTCTVLCYIYPQYITLNMRVKC